MLTFHYELSSMLSESLVVDGMSLQLFEKNRGGIGFTFTRPTAYIEYWLNSWQGDKPLLDLGCGHGINTFAALNHGARVVAADIKTPALERQPELTCEVARLPDDIPFAENSFSGILCAEVFHFLSNEQVQPAIDRLYSLLQPEGYLVVTCASCEVAVLKATGLEHKTKTAWQKHPEHFHGQNDYIDLLEQAASVFNQPDITDSIIESHRQNIPDRFFNFYIPGQLASAFSRTGFRVLISELGPAPHYPVWTHGDRDQVRIVAQKKRNFSPIYQGRTTA